MLRTIGRSAALSLWPASIKAKARTKVDGSTNLLSLPTKPNNPKSSNHPQAYLHGLKAEVAEKDLRDFFHELDVVGVTTGPKEGEAKVEFKDRETLVRCVP